MASFISATEAADYQNAMGNLHDTFKRPIIIFQTAQQTIISTNPNHNFLYPSDSSNSSSNDVVSNVVVSGNYFARIHYESEQKTRILRAGYDNVSEQVDVEDKAGKVKLIFDADTYAIVKNCTRVTFDSGIYQVVSDARPHGVIGTQFFNLNLKPLS